jgi:SSS family transporter
MQNFDWFVVFFFLAALMAASIYLGRFNKSFAEMFTGKGLIPWWVLGLSVYMSAFSANAFVADSWISYHHGLVGAMCWAFDALAFVVAGFYFARRWRRTRMNTAVEYIEARYSKVFLQYNAVTGFFIKLFDAALKIYATGILVSTIVGIPLYPAIVFISVFVFVFTAIGGLWAVTLSDTIQSFILGVAVVVILFLALGHVGGIASFIQNAKPGDFALATKEFPLSFVIASFVIKLTVIYASWDSVQRWNATKSDKESARMCWLIAGILAITPFIICLPVIVGKQFLPALEGLEAEQAYIQICMKLLPAGLLGLMITSMFAATMSSLNTSYNVMSSVFVNDIYRRFINPKASDRKLANMGRTAMVTVGIMAMVLAFFIKNLGGACQMLFEMLGLVWGPMQIPIVIGIMTRKTPTWGAITASILGFISGFVGKFVFDFPYFGYVMTNISITVGVCVLTGILFPPLGERKKALDNLFGLFKKPVDISDQVEKEMDVPPSSQIVGIFNISIAIILFVSLFFIDPAQSIVSTLVIGVALLIIGVIPLVMAFKRKQFIFKEFLF